MKHVEDLIYQSLHCDDTYLKGLNNRKKFGRPNDMSPEMEEILAQHLMNLESCFFGLTTTEFRKLAFELCFDSLKSNVDRLN
mgnify:CR=1 FL=1